MENNKLKSSRKAAGLTIKRMSELLEIPTRTIESWEAGDRKPPAYVERLVVKELDNIRKEKEHED